MSEASSGASEPCVLAEQAVAQLVDRLRAPKREDESATSFAVRLVKAEGAEQALGWVRWASSPAARYGDIGGQAEPSPSADSESSS